MRVAFAIPGDLAMLSGGYGYDRAVLRDLPQCGIETDYIRLPDGFPFPDRMAISRSCEELRASNADILLIDGLAFGALPAHELQQVSVPMIALVHHPLGLEAGLTREQSRALIESERRVLTCARHVVVTSQTTKQTLVDDFGVSSNSVTVAMPGIERASRARGSGRDTLQILAVGAVIARKAYDVLISALADVRDLPWHLTIVGSLDRDVKLAASLHQQMSDQELADRITLAGERDPSSLSGLYDRADLFVLSSHYEGYGMVLGEAMAHGLPIVTSTGGASGSTVSDAAALKVPPGDARALASALRRVLQDTALRHELAEASYAAGQKLPTWMETAQVIATVLTATSGAKA